MPLALLIVLLIVMAIINANDKADKAAKWAKVVDGGFHLKDMPQFEWSLLYDEYTKDLHGEHKLFPDDIADFLLNGSNEEAYREYIWSMINGEAVRRGYRPSQLLGGGTFSISQPFDEFRVWHIRHDARLKHYQETGERVY